MPRYILPVCKSLGISLTFSYRPGTILRLPDDMLLKIFRYYVDASPRSWPRLVHICRKWRRIVFTSQQALHLRLSCSSGKPVSKALDFWPPLPIVIEYGGSLALDPLSPVDELNIIAALKRSDRVSLISLTVTTSLLDKLYAVERPFMELEDLVLLSQDSVPLTLPSSFRWGSRLRRLHLTRITFPAHLPLLYSSRNLVDLKLHEALNPWYFPIEELTDALSRMAQLQSLSLQFPSTSDYVSLPPPPDRRVVLPALTRLDFQGIAEYLERLVHRLDTPRLENIQVTFLDIWFHDLSRLGEFIDRIGMHQSHHQAYILSSESAISISLTQQHGAPTCLELRLFSELLSEQLSVMSQIFLHLSPFLLSVEDLRISAARPSSQEDSLCSGRWQELITSFTGVKWLHLYGDDTTNIARALQKANSRHQTVLPALHKLYLPQPRPRHVPLSGDIVAFMISRWRSGYPIGVAYERLYHFRRGPGTLYSQCLYLYLYILTRLTQDLYLSRSRMMRCSPTTSF